jgi:hypothetical protein
VTKGTCTSYDVTNLSDSAKKKACEEVKDNGGTEAFCAWTSGNTCIAKKACAEYSGNDEPTCNGFSDTNGKVCTVDGSTGKCKDGGCADKKNATSSADCAA